MTDTTTKIPVSARALVARINRRLASKGRRLHAVRGDRAMIDLGDFFVLDTDDETIVQTNVDPEALGRELKALRSYETVAGTTGAGPTHE